MQNSPHGIDWILCTGQLPDLGFWTLMQTCALGSAGSETSWAPIGCVTLRCPFDFPVFGCFWGKQKDSKRIWSSGWTVWATAEMRIKELPERVEVLSRQTGIKEDPASLFEPWKKRTPLLKRALLKYALMPCYLLVVRIAISSQSDLEVLHRSHLLCEGLKKQTLNMNLRALYSCDLPWSTHRLIRLIGAICRIEMSAP